MRDLVDEECGGRFHVAVTATLSMLGKALVVVSRRGEERREECVSWEQICKCVEKRSDLSRFARVV